jgi:hypothetical protein
MLSSLFVPCFYLNRTGLEVLITPTWFFEFHKGFWSSSRFVMNQFIMHPFPDWMLLPFSQLLWVSLLLALETWGSQRAKGVIPKALITSHLILLVYMISAMVLKAGEFADVIPIPLISFAGVYWLFRQWRVRRASNQPIHESNGA